MNTTTESVIEIIDFQDAKEALVSNHIIAVDFLRGSWKSSDGIYYFKVEAEDNNGGNHISYNIPHFEMPDSYFGIVDGHVFLYSHGNPGYAYRHGDYKLLFDIDVVSVQQIIVYSYKSDLRYTLFRDA